MGEETTQTTNNSLTPDGMLRSIAGLLEKAGIGNAASVAANLPTSGDPSAAPPDVATKDQNNGQSLEERKKAFVDPLRKSFELLASHHKSYAKLGSTAALDDPYTFLRKKDDRGNYMVSMADLDIMAMTLLDINKGQAGEPLMKWAGQHAPMVQANLQKGLRSGLFDGQTAKALDTSLNAGVGGGALIRTDIEPILLEGYLRSFPAAERIRTFPSNGLETSPSELVFVGKAEQRHHSLQGLPQFSYAP
jgi:hypothetical protein